MQASTGNVMTIPSAYTSSRKATTTLYDLMEALIDEAGPEEEELATLAVLDLFRSGRVKWVNPPQDHEFSWFTESAPTELTA